jgi:hypothetical protein
VSVAAGEMHTVGLPMPCWTVVGWCFIVPFLMAIITLGAIPETLYLFL